MIFKTNPYVAGNPVGGGDAFIGRADVLRDVLRVIKSPSENAMVLYGQRRIGKTSVLMELRTGLSEKGSYAPVYFDLQDKAALPLERVLRELGDHILNSLEIPAAEHPSDDFSVGFQKEFLPYILSQLPEDTALVLLFDEFDVLDNPGGNQAGTAFFPYLRELMRADTGRLKFVFVIGRHPEDLSNIMLALFKGIKSRHVSLMSPEDTIDHPEDRQHYILKQIYRELNSFFLETWKVWKPEIRKTFTFVAVAHQAHLLKKEGFFNKAFLKGIAEWKPELDELQVRGWIRPNSDFQGGYCLNSQIMLTWLADELAKLGRDSQSFENWLQDKGIDGAFLSVNEKKIFSKTITDSVRALYQPTIPMFSAVLQEMTKMQ